MPGQNLIQSVGGQSQKPTHFVSLFTSRFFNGLVTNRNLLRGPLGFLYTDFYHAGTTDVLCDGINSELSVRLSMCRRPGNPKFSSVMTSSAVDSFYSFRPVGGAIQVITDTVDDIEYMTPSTKTNIWIKTTGSGESYFQGVNKSLYISDGIDQIKYIPSVANNTNQFGQGSGNFAWLFSPVAPLFAPTLTVTSSGSGGVAWVASTFFSTMGFIVDSNGDIEQLTSVNALQNNTTQFGLSGNGSPPWNQNLGGTTTDGGTVVWTNQGLITLWAPNTLYAPGAPIFDPTTNTIQVMSHTTGRTSGATKPVFSATLFNKVDDTNSAGHGGGNARWKCQGTVNGSPTAIKTWAPGDTWNQYTSSDGASGTTNVNSATVEPGIPTAAAISAGTLFYLQGATTAGTSASSFVTPPWQAPGQYTQDNQLTWFNLGSEQWAPGTLYTAWPGVNNVFSAVVDSSNPVRYFWVCIVGGISGGSLPFTTSPTYGTTVVESSGVTWVCVGNSNNSIWVANSSYYLPAVGFSPPTSTNPYGGAVVFDTNSPVDSEFVVNSGFSGGSAPSWQSPGNYTTDNQVTWYNNGAFTGLGFAWTKGYGYVFAYKSRAANDPDVTIAPPLAQVIPSNPNVMGPLGPPTGAEDGSVSTASPVGFFGSPTAAPNAGGIITVQGKYSLDPAIDTIMVFRSTDGFQTSGPYLLVTEIANNTALATDPTVANTGLFTVYDFMADTPSVVGGVTLPGLNELIEAPIGHANDPIPGQYGSTQFQQAVGAPSVNPLNPFAATAAGSAAIGLTFHQGRLWAFIGSNVFASGGPDTIVGNGFTAWPPINVWPFQSNVTRLLSTTSGLLVYTTTGLYIIAGGPSITTYYSQLLVDGLGLLSWNALALMAGVPYVFAADRQLIGVEPGTGIVRAGHPIGDILSTFNPLNVYLTYHSYGDLDHALFIGDGSTRWFRCDTNLAPDSSYVGPVWSPSCTIAGGFQAIASIETTPGTRQLLIGPTSAGYVLARDSTYSIFSDGGAVGTGIGGTAYESFFTMGNIVMCSAGQMAEMAFIEASFIQTGSQPGVYVLFDELGAFNGASFEKISNYMISDPPKKYGPTATPKTMWSNRYYFSQTTPGNPGNVPLPAWCKSFQLKIDFGNTDTVQNEMLSFTIFGALWQEN